jgi:ferredoxin-fold anticodon binding domain-containing protein
MNISDLSQFLNQHGRIVYTNKLGESNILYGYIREVNCDHVVWQDNEKPDKFKIRNVKSFDIMKLPIAK